MGALVQNAMLGSGSDFLTSYSSSYGSGSTSQKVTVPMVPVLVPQHCIQHGQGEKHRLRIFSPSWNTPLRYCHKKRLCSAGKIWFDFPLAIFSPYYTISESRTIITWSNGEKIKTRGKNIIYFPPVGFLCSFQRDN